MSQFGELPAFTASNYADALTRAMVGQASNAVFAQQWADHAPRRMMTLGGQSPTITQTVVKQEDKKMSNVSCRLVKVFIADADENVPLEKRLLYRGDEKLTDLTDQELFFEVPINDLLTKHNELRRTLEDKKANKDKPVFLEPIRVRDLRMLVVSLANF